MKHIIIALALSSTGLLVAQDSAPTSLMDGKTLAGWAPLKGAPGAGWTVVDGAIHLDGTKGGELLSAKEYSSFELEWDWKIEAGGNNGLKYWVATLDGKSLGIEYQMIDDHKHADGLRGGSHTTASIYDIKEPKADKPLKPVGEWNHSKVVVKDGKIEHWLNGQMVVDADTRSEDWKTRIAASKFKGKVGFAPGKGRIMLTDHGDKVWFKAMTIKEL
jgi:Domain of Unknown Function (DUF1080)